jgi:hypothetical protein
VIERPEISVLAVPGWILPETMDEKLAQCYLILIQVDYSLTMLQQFCWMKWDFIAWDVSCTPCFALRWLSRQTVFGWYDNWWRGDQGWLSYQILKEVCPLTSPFLARSPNPLLHIAKVHGVPILSILPVCGRTFRFPNPSVRSWKGKRLLPALSPSQSSIY